MGEANYSYRVEAREGYVYVYQSGTFTTEPELRELHAAIEGELATSKLRCVMFDNRDATQTREELRAIMWTWLTSTRMLRRAAIIVHSPRINRRAENTAKLNRVALQAFASEEEAASWLVRA